MQYSNKYIEFCLEAPNSIFKNLNLKEKESITQNHKLYHIKKGRSLFKEGEKAHGLICLASGKVKLYSEGVGGRKQILSMEKPSDIFGYRTLFGDSKWHMTGEAVEDSTICVLEKGPLVKIIKKNADLSFRFSKLLSEELHFANNRIISLTQKHVRGRVAESLLMLRNIYGQEEDKKAIAVYLSREDIASLSSMTTSNAIRTLSNLASEGIISLKGRRISLLDLTALEYISELG
jgi:CRP-like cAMP-binding protein